MEVSKTSFFIICFLIEGLTDGCSVGVVAGAGKTSGVETKISDCLFGMVRINCGLDGRLPSRSDFKTKTLIVFPSIEICAVEYFCGVIVLVVCVFFVDLGCFLKYDFTFNPSAINSIIRTIPKNTIKFVFFCFLTFVTISSYIVYLLINYL